MNRERGNTIVEKYIFTYIHDEGKIEVETSEIFINDIIMNFRGFLLAAGFQPATLARALNDEVEELEEEDLEDKQED